MKGKEDVFIILSPGFPENEEETTCLPLQQSFVKTLNELYPHLRVKVLSFQYPYHRSDYTWHNIPVKSFQGKNRSGIARRWIWHKVRSALAQEHKTKNILGILSFWYDECALVGKKFADKHGVPHRCWILGQDAKKQNGYVAKTKPRPTELVALSEFLQDEFEKNHHIRPAHLVPPGIDFSLLNENNITRDIDILGAGYLIPLKQFDIFIEIVAAAKKHYPGIKAVIAGRGPEKEKLQKLIAKLNLNDNITLCGELSHPSLLKLMQRSKIFMHTSSYEGFSGVCLEALHAGATVISFTKPMTHDIPNWHIVHSPAEMTENIISMLKKDLPHQSFRLFPIADTVTKMVASFGL